MDISSRTRPSPRTPAVPVGCRHVKRTASSKASPSGPKTDKAKAAEFAVRVEELLNLPDLIKTHFKTWTDGARDFQLESMEAQVLGKDVLIHAATGSGKTGIAAGPHLLPSSKGKVTLFVSPLLALHDEQVLIFYMFCRT
jgi:replicative superfamily II helicase